MYRVVWTGVRLPSTPLSISWRCIRLQKPNVAPFLMKNIALHFTQNGKLFRKHFNYVSKPFFIHTKWKY
jgi:hypothetical protein